VYVQTEWYLDAWQPSGILWRIKSLLMVPKVKHTNVNNKAGTVYILQYSSINACGRCLHGVASNVHLTKMRSVPLIRCLPKLSPSSSTSTGSQIGTWRRSLTWTRREFSFDLQSLYHRDGDFIIKYSNGRFDQFNFQCPSINVMWPIVLRPHWSNRRQLIFRYDKS